MSFAHHAFRLTPGQNSPHRNDYLIIRKLQNNRAPRRSKDWFGMAEQAINTIYALGEHPDALCNTITKNLTQRAFTPRSKTAAADPDAMDEDGGWGYYDDAGRLGAG
jgi:hypothetical protein